MTTLADPPVTPPAVARRPRMRRPAHEPEPVGTGPPPRADVIADRAPATRPAAVDLRPSTPDGAPTTRADDDVRRRAAATVRAMVEVLAGRRSPAHLADIARPEVVRYLTASRSTGSGAPVAPARVHVSRPTRHAAEIVAVCRFGDRFRALTVRLDREATGRGHTWCATAVRLL